MCGGWTVWCALQGFDLKATDHVGIVGVGGLGHLAIQFASKMGCEVTVFSRTESKKAEALALGANHFIATENAAEYKVARPINVLLITANSHIDWKLYVPAMSARGTIFPLQIPDDPDWFAPISFPHMPFLIKGLQVIYSTGGRLDAVDKMLAFAALHNVKPTIECFPLNKAGIEKGFEKLQSGKMRYRGVLVAQ
jgi:D-arabinose 1-dehydrogenase-like Zn-dependent alcohol dehydrogenase